MSYRKTLEALRAYEPKRLGQFRYLDKDGCACAIGAVVPATLLLHEEEEDWSIASLLFNACPGNAVLTRSEELGLRFHEASRLQYENDGCEATPEGRYAHVLAWLEARVAEEDARG